MKDYSEQMKKLVSFDFTLEDTLSFSTAFIDFLAKTFPKLYEEYLDYHEKLYKEEFDKHKDVISSVKNLEFSSDFWDKLPVEFLDFLKLYDFELFNSCLNYYDVIVKKIGITFNNSKTLLESIAFNSRNNYGFG